MEASLKKNILIGIAVSAGILLLLALIFLFFFNAQFNVYQDDQYKFSIKYPKTWRVIVHPHPNVAVVFMRPMDTALDTLQENFNVTIQAVPNTAYTLDAFNATVKRQLTGVFGKSIVIVEDKPMQWGWHDGHQIAINAPDPDHLKMVNAWVLYHEQAYIMTFFGDMNKYSGDSFFVNEMIRSLQLQ